VAKAQAEMAEDREKAAERRRRWRADHEGGNGWWIDDGLWVGVV